MRIDRLDHLVLTDADIERTCAFYASVLGMEVASFGDGRQALHFGRQKINLHQQGQEFEPKAARPTPGSADLYFISETSIEEVIERFSRLGVEIVEGPVARTGATGRMISVYVRDPDRNLIEVSNYTKVSNHTTGSLPAGGQAPAGGAGRTARGRRRGAGVAATPSPRKREAPPRPLTGPRKGARV